MEASEKSRKRRKNKAFSAQKIYKKFLTKDNPSVIIVKLAYGKPRKSEPANLENDTEKKRANIKERLAKIPKSLKHESV